MGAGELKMELSSYFRCAFAMRSFSAVGLSPGTRLCINLLISSLESTIRHQAALVEELLELLCGFAAFTKKQICLSTHISGIK
jgi:hypothetical protein